MAITIQDFLVGLGFKIDQASAKRFKDTLDHGARQVKEFRLALLGLAIGVEEAVRRTTRSFEQLFFAAKSTGVSARDISNLQYAFKEIGLSAEAANADIASLAATLREPAFKGQVEALVGPVKDAGDAFIKLAQKYAEAVKAGGEMGGEALGLRYFIEKIPGVNFDNLRRASQNLDIFTEAIKTNDRIARDFGLDQAKAAEQARKVQSAWNEFAQTITLGIGKLVSENFDVIQDILKTISEWLRSPEIRAAFGKLLSDFRELLKAPESKQAFLDFFHAITQVIEAVAWAFGQVKDAFRWLQDKVGPDWAVALAAAALIFGPSIVGGLVSGMVAALATGMTTVASAMFAPLIAAAAPAAATIAAILGSAIAGALASAGGYLVGSEIDKRTRWGGWMDSLMQGLFGHPSGVELSDEQKAKGRTLDKPPHFQGGGIVNANLHHGEMVLPANISAGLQQLLSRPSLFSEGGGGAGLAAEFRRWWSGDGSFRPIFDLAGSVYEKLEDVLMTVFDVVLKAMGYKEGARPGAGAAEGVSEGDGGGERTGTAAGGRMPGRVTQRAGGEGGVSMGEMKQLLIDAGFKPDEVPTMAAILMHESSGDPNALNKTSGAAGLAQVNPAAWGQDLANQSMGNPKRSAEIARMIFEKQGFAAWSSYNRGYYKQFMEAAESAKPVALGTGNQQREAGDRSGRYDSTGAYGVPGAVMNYGSTGAVGGPGENMTMIRTPSGKPVTINAAAKEAFSGFLKDLEDTGYKIRSIGGYSKREKRGGSGWSEHAYGTAIDINPETNPFRSSRTDMPKNIHELAAKWGLVWGGDWKDPKDTMHFQWGGSKPWQHTALGADKQARNNQIESNHTVNVNIHGSEDPRATARAVADLQDRRSAMHMRNLRPLVA